MSVNITRPIWDNLCIYDACTLLVLLAVADFAHEDGGGIYAGTQRIADKCRLSTKFTTAAMRGLAADGVLKKTRSHGGGRVREYRIDLERLGELQKAHEVKDDNCERCARRRARAASKGNMEDSGDQTVKREHDAVKREHDGDSKGNMTPSKGNMTDAHIDITITEPPVVKPLVEPSARSEAKASKPKSKGKKQSTGMTTIGEYVPDEEEKQKAVAYWTERGRADLGARVDDIVEGFVAFHKGKGSRMASWPHAWITWRKNAMPMEKLGAVAPAASAAQRFARYTSEQWRGCMERYYGGLGKWDGAAAGSWPKEAGPAPGKEDCRCPIEILYAVSKEAQDVHKFKIPLDVVRVCKAYKAQMEAKASTP